THLGHSSFHGTNLFRRRTLIALLPLIRCDCMFRGPRNRALCRQSSFHGSPTECDLSPPSPCEELPQATSEAPAQARLLLRRQDGGPKLPKRRSDAAEVQQWNRNYARCY